MKISTRGRYALRMMLDLAKNHNGEPVSLHEISTRQEISEKYCEQIMALLNKGKLVTSTRGAKGGYSLARRPEDYTIGEILRITEGDMAPVECVDNESYCSRRTQCITIKLWEKIGLAISDIVDNTTLADLLSWGPECGDDYII